MNKLVAFFDLFRKGSAVTAPGLWKNVSGFTIALSGLLLAGCNVAQSFGYAFALTPEQASNIALGVATVAGLFSTYATSDKVGLLPAKPPVPPVSPPAAAPAGPVQGDDQPSPWMHNGG